MTMILLLWALYWQYVAYTAFHHLRYNDFARFYEAVHSWQHVSSLYAPTSATWIQLPESKGVHLWNLTPPHVSLMFWPLMALTIGAAYTVWVWVTIACFVLSAHLIVTTLQM